MFESHFGLSGPPFQLNADPAFFFGSRGHSHALAYMRFGVHQAEGFIVVTGEVGAGKTTLVRTLMSSLEQERVVAAQVVQRHREVIPGGEPVDGGRCGVEGAAQRVQQGLGLGRMSCPGAGAG